MGILGRITGAIKWIVNAPFIAFDYVLSGLASACGTLRAAIGDLTGVRKKPPIAKIRAELRQQWLELAFGEKDIPGVEWEGEIFYETPK